MEFELWWLLALPLFFGLGWAASRLDARQSSRASGRLPDAYFRGLNFLLNDQPDRAIDAFVDVVRLDPETIELHFALGNLFRRRGETDRAIRVHQSLGGRNDLDAAQRARALYELGQDFLKAGLLDRAEDAFGRLAGTPHERAALTHRLEIAQIVRDWPTAIALAQRIDGDADTDDAELSRTDIPRRIAHFHCELAEAALADGTPDGAQRAAREIDAALAIDPHHPRAWLLRGEIATARHDHEATIEALRRLAEVEPDHLALAAPAWIAAHEAVGRLDAGIEALEAVQARRPSVDLLSAIADARARRDGPAAAAGWAEAQMRGHPSLLGLDRLLALRQADGQDLDPARRDELSLLRGLIQTQAGRLSRYGCRHCGFQARRFPWQCPGCNRWDTYAPRRNEELDAAA